MESTNVLDTSCELSIAALHYVYLPIIQQHLDHFAAALAHRSLRLEHRQTPMQLFMAGQIQTARTKTENMVIRIVLILIL